MIGGNGGNGGGGSNVPVPNVPVPKNNNPRPVYPRPDFCTQRTVQFDTTQYISYSDINVHLQLLGLIQVGINVDISAVISIVFGSGPTRSPIRRRQLLNPGIINGNNNGNGNGNNNNGIPPPAKTVKNPQRLPQGVKDDPDAIRRALLRQYSVQCDYSFSGYHGVQVTTVTSITECLQTCTRSAFSARGRPGRGSSGPQECLGASMSRITKQCWYVVGQAKTTIDVKVGVKAENIDSVIYAL